MKYTLATPKLDCWHQLNNYEWLNYSATFFMDGPGSVVRSVRFGSILFGYGEHIWSAVS